MTRPSRSRQRSTLPLILIILGTLIVIAAVIVTLSNQGQATPPQTAATSSFATPTFAVVGEPSFPEVERVSLDDSKAAFDQGNAVFLDVRSAESYAQGHIAGAVSIPLGELGDRIGELDPNDWIITYCT
jgi:hypothetical protein